MADISADDEITDGERSGLIPSAVGSPDLCQQGGVFLGHDNLGHV